MAYGGGEYIDFSLPAAADFSSHQYKIMTIDANGRGTICTGNTVRAIGILQNKPAAADAPARIRILGPSKYKAGAAANEGDGIAANGEGFGTACTTDKTYIVGYVLAAPGGSADVQSIMVQPGMVAG
jgi:hypothetical protein